MAEQAPFEISQEYAEKLFVHVYVDLKQRTKGDDNFRMYNQLNMARLIRQLLIDGSGLFSLANRYNKCPIRFILGKCGPAPANLESIPEIYTKLNLVPSLNDFPPGYYLEPCRIDSFLAYSPINLSDREFSVREIVKYVANQFGGVHLSPCIKDEDDQILARFNDWLKVGNDGVVLKMVDQITNMTLRGLAPLVKTIEDKYETLAKSAVLSSP